MSENVNNELNELKQINQQMQARMSAGEQFTNGLLKDLIDTKTSLNLHVSANIELNQSKMLLDEELKKMKIENDYLRDELNKLKEAEQAASPADAA